MSERVPVEGQRDPIGFNDLPDECLEYIIDNVAFVELVTVVPLVCKLWRITQYNVCMNKASLILYGDPKETLTEPVAKQLFKYTGLSIESESPPSFTVPYGLRYGKDKNRALIQKKFSYLQTLNVIHNRLYPHQSSLFDLMNSLTKMQLKLHIPEWTRLKLIVHSLKEGESDETWNKFWQKLGLFPHLRHLTLYSRSPVSGFHHSDLEFLDVVEGLELGGFEVDLTRLQKIRHLGLYHMPSRWQWFSQLQRMEEDITNNVTQLTVFPLNDQLEFDYLDTVTSKFKSLKYLHIRTRLPMNEVITYLGRLPQIKHLRIWHYLATRPTAVPLSYISPDELYDQITGEQLIPPLPSVEMLHLYIYVRNHNQLYWIPKVFPNLKWIKFDRFDICCTKCANKDWKRCEELTLSPLTELSPNLCRIFVDRKGLTIEGCESIQQLTHYDTIAPKSLMSSLATAENFIEIT